MNPIFKRIAAVFAALRAGIAATAKFTTSGLDGHVSDESEVPLVGAAVIAIHTPSGIRYAAETNSEAAYHQRDAHRRAVPCRNIL